MKLDKIINFLAGALTIIPGLIFSLKLLGIPLANWVTILLFSVSIIAFIFILIFAYNTYKNKRETKFIVDNDLGQDKSTNEYIESLQKQLSDSEVEQKYLSSLFNNAVTIIDELQIAANGVVSDTDRVQALYRRFEASGEKNIKTFIKKQQQKFGKNLELDRLIDNN